MLRAIWTTGWLLAACAAPLAAAEPDAVRVPVAPPHIIILVEDEPEPVWREPFVAPENEIVLRQFSGPPPADVLAAITMLRVALPPDWLAATMRSFGYVPNRSTRSVRSARSDLRNLDLTRFLFARWVFADPETRLAREFSCMSNGEFDIGVFMTLLVVAEASMPEDADGWHMSQSTGRSRLARLSPGNARAAWYLCTRLVDRGWTVPR